MGDDQQTSGSATGGQQSTTARTPAEEYEYAWTSFRPMFDAEWAEDPYVEPLPAEASRRLEVAFFLTMGHAILVGNRKWDDAKGDFDYYVVALVAEIKRLANKKWFNKKPDKDDVSKAVNKVVKEARKGHGGSVQALGNWCMLIDEL